MKNIIKAPLMTEKNTNLNAIGVYVFKVDRKSSKEQIRKTIENNFKVKVLKVRTSLCRGKSKNSKFGPTKVSHWKKAYVKLVSGEKIALFEGV